MQRGIQGFVVIPLLLVGILILGGVVLIATKTSVLKNATLDLDNNLSTIPTGELTGRITGGYYAKAISKVEIAIGEEVKATTDDSGEFKIIDISTGNHTISFKHPEYTFTSFEIAINQGENKLDKDVHGNLTNPKPSAISVSCFIDANKNSIKDAGERAINGSANISIWESDKWVQQKYLLCDTNGNYRDSLAKIGKYKFEPGGYTFYAQPAAKEIVIDGYGNPQTLNFGYIPLKVESGFTVYVFNDKNENGSRDTDEENIHYQYVRITNQTGIITQPLGNSYNSAVSAEDGSSFNQFDPGTYKFELIPENASWDFYYKITKKEATVNFTQTTGHQTIFLGAHKLF